MVFAPGASEFEGLSGLDVGEAADDGDEFVAAGGLEAGDGVARIFGGKGDALDYPRQCVSVGCGGCGGGVEGGGHGGNGEWRIEN